MNKSYDVYLCREPEQVFRVPINNYAPLGDTFGYIPPMQQMMDDCFYTPARYRKKCANFITAYVLFFLAAFFGVILYHGLCNGVTP